MAEIILIETIFSVVIERIASSILDKLISFFRNSYRVKKFPEIWKNRLSQYLIAREVNFYGFICEFLSLNELPISATDDEIENYKQQISSKLGEVYERNGDKIDSFLKKIKKGLKENDSILNLRILERDFDTAFFKKLFFPIDESNDKNHKLLHSEMEVLECIRISFLDSYLEFFKIDDMIRFLVDKSIINQDNAEKLYDELTGQKDKIKILISEIQRDHNSIQKLENLLIDLIRNINTTRSITNNEIHEMAELIIEQSLDPRLDSIIAILNKVDDKIKEIQEQQLKDSAKLDEIDNCTQSMCERNQKKEIQIIKALLRDLGPDFSTEKINKLTSEQYMEFINRLRESLKSFNLIRTEYDRMGELTDLEMTLIDFFKKYNRWWFNLPRIKYWGSKQAEEYKKFKDPDLRSAVDNLARRRLIKTKISEKGFKMYKIL